ncbi:MAG: hypothetical protein ACODAJ_11725, partial [Planctomycetota bacterium]
ARPEAIAPQTEEPPDPLVAQSLLAEGPLTREEIERQVRVAGKADSALGRLLAGVQAPREAELFALLAAGYQVPEVDLKQCKVHVPTARSIPRAVALKYKMVPIERMGDLVCVVFSGEPSPKGIAAIRRETGARVKALRCPAHHLQILLRRLYAERPAAAAAGDKATPAVPISKHEHDAAVADAAGKAEARWEGLYATRGPVRASRLGRR